MFRKVVIKALFRADILLTNLINVTWKIFGKILKIINNKRIFSQWNAFEKIRNLYVSGVFELKDRFYESCPSRKWALYIFNRPSCYLNKQYAIKHYINRQNLVHKFIFILFVNFLSEFTKSFKKIKWGWKVNTSKINISKINTIKFYF